jgi:hypothetical protein
MVRSGTGVTCAHRCIFLRQAIWFVDVRLCTSRGRRRYKVSTMVISIHAANRQAATAMRHAGAIGSGLALVPWLFCVSPVVAQTVAAQPAVTAPTQAAQPTSIGGWPAADVQVEQARCTQLFKGLNIVARPVSPMREHDCGAAAPMELISVGKSPQVAFSPPVIVTCDMAVALHRWVASDLQGLARKHLGSPLVRVDTMSSYSCRNAYGRKNGRLSEHGRANAIDVRSFTTASGATAEVLTDWGPTGHEIASQVAAAKKLEAQRAVAAATAASTAAMTARTQAVPPAPGTPTTGQQNGTPALYGLATGSLPSPQAADPASPRPAIALGTRNNLPVGIPMPGASDTGLGLWPGIGTPSRLGGPKAEAPTGLSAAQKMDFLRGAHTTACHIFGTVLGPEANAAHRNHFHVDMAERKVRSICE